MLAAIPVSAFAGGLVAVLGVSRVLPVVLGWLRCWWFPAPLVLFLAAVVRYWWSVRFTRRLIMILLTR